MSKYESRYHQIKLLVEQIHERHKRNHPNAQGCDTEYANEFIRAVANLVDRPFLTPENTIQNYEHT